MNSLKALTVIFMLFFNFFVGRFDSRYLSNV
ncbi:hypothetical protein RDI58_025124 [Solanum bulbocastanum]|uniref:Uncharacterized protein n=1 Tax=Solanum bulbocastanum TaxID=147425 RepID=A0AAN8Y4A6_SOLBU